MNFQLDLYSKLYLARNAEIAIKKYYAENEMTTPMHMSYGQEICPVGVCHALEKEDQVYGTYRSHALYLSKCGNLIKFFGEMYGKVNGIVNGKGGSMHLSDREFGFMGASAIVAATIPVSIGAAFALKLKNNGNISVPFFGDGAIDEGNFWESVNIATSKSLPVLFVLEDNGLAVNTPSSIRHGYKSIVDVMRQFDFAYVNYFDTTVTPNVECVYNIAKECKSEMLNVGKPGFLCIKVERGIQHVGIDSDYDGIKRIKPDTEDSVDFYRKIALNIESDEYIKSIEKKIDSMIEDAIVQAKLAISPSKDELYKGIFE